MSSIFLTEKEKKTINSMPCYSPGTEFLWALSNRVQKRAENIGILDNNTTQQWWHASAEYITDASLIYALKKDESVKSWLRSNVLSIVRRPEGDWVGPWFRRNPEIDETGHLETAHLSWCTAVALDLAGEIFTDDEKKEITGILRNRAIPMCRAYLDRQKGMHNWRAVLAAGMTVAAAVVEDEDAFERGVKEFNLNRQLFQEDGSSGESLQYANYTMYGMTLSYEAIIRKKPEYAAKISLTPMTRTINWFASALFYTKPLTRWGQYPRPRSANFNDSTALFAPTPDCLLQIAARCRESAPKEAGLARWLYEKVYTDVPQLGPFDLATFGFHNKGGFLVLSFLTDAAKPLSPAEAGINEFKIWSNGDAHIRDSWDGKTVLAVHGANEKLNCANHQHGDLNSFILVHNKERMLLDPGHSCYRGLLHGIEISTSTHNTCDFIFENEKAMEGSLPGKDASLQQMLTMPVHSEQRFPERRMLSDNMEPGPKIDRMGDPLIAIRYGNVSITGFNVARAYDKRVENFSRFWMLCGSHALFIVDMINTVAPALVRWNFLLNNRDGKLEFKSAAKDRIVARRGNAGMKLFHNAVDEKQKFSQSLAYSYVHDAYHPLPGHFSEGGSGSGYLVRFTENESFTGERVAVNAIAVDRYGAVASWHFKREGHSFILEGPNATESWKLNISDNYSMLIEALHEESKIDIFRENEQWITKKD